MAVYLLRQRQIESHQHGGPDDCVKAHDLLADKVHVGGPVFLVVGIVVRAVAHGGDVVGQCVHPHIHNVLRVKVHRDAPGEACPGDAQILKALLDERDHLVFAAFGLDELRMLLIQLQNAVGIFGETEEIRFLLGPLDLTAAVRAFAVLQLRFGPEGLAGGAVPAVVFSLVDIAAIVQLAEDLLHGLDVIVVRGADEAVVADVQQLPQLLEVRDNLIDILLGGHALGLGLLLDFQAVLVRAGEEHHVIPLHSAVAGDRVAGHGAVAVADVRVARGIIDGSRDVERLFLHNDEPSNRSEFFRGCGRGPAKGNSRAAERGNFFYFTINRGAVQERAAKIGRNEPYSVGADVPYKNSRSRRLFSSTSTPSTRAPLGSVRSSYVPSFGTCIVCCS